LLGSGVQEAGFGSWLKKYTRYGPERRTVGIPADPIAERVRTNEKQRRSALGLVAARRWRDGRFA
jgi:hypothetical protein